MTIQNFLLGIKNLLYFLWELIKWQPGLILGTILAVFIGKLAHLKKRHVNLLEEFFGLFL